MSEKKCEYCNKQLKRRDNELEVHWEARRFCNRSCAVKWSWDRRKKNA